MRQGPSFEEADRLVAEAFLDRHYRPTVVAVIRDAMGRYLIVQSAKDPATWYFPQGGIEEGETSLDAFHRELKEETGIEPDTLVVLGGLGVEDIDAPAGRADRRGFTRGKRYVPIQAIYLGKLALALDPSEVRCYSWAMPTIFRVRISDVRPEKRDFMMRLLDAAERPTR